MSTPVNQAIVAYSTPVGDKDYDYTFEMTTVDYPTIDEEGDEVIIKVEAAPINPSDLGRMMAGGVWVAALSKQGTKQAAPGKLVTSFPKPIFEGRTSLQATSPVRMGNEGCGTVVAAGAKAKALIGKRVCFVTGQSYVKFAKASMMAVVPLPDGMAAELGASAFVNPHTVVGFVQCMRKEGHTALVHTAAASALGQMLVKYCIVEKVPLVNIVRKAEQAELLKSLGTYTSCKSLHSFSPFVRTR
jgi:NADPH:quinone reductase-like Zn-dependent oxidoreductase